MNENRRVVCNRCSLVINDCEPMSRLGQFWHTKDGNPCMNAGRYLVPPTGCRPFMRKRERRQAKRNAKR